MGFAPAFDVFGRRGEIFTARKCELRPSPPHTLGAAKFSTLTLFPDDLHLMSKPRRLDDTVLVGFGDRASVTGRWPLPPRVAVPQGRKINVSQRLYDRVCNEAGSTIGLALRTASQMQHGAAIVDALANAYDQELLECGRWATAVSSRCDRPPAEYMTLMALLSPAQLRQALEAPAAIRRLAAAGLASKCSSTRSRRRA